MIAAQVLSASSSQLDITGIIGGLGIVGVLRWVHLHRRAEADDEAEGELEFPVPDTALSDIDAAERSVIVDRALQDLPAHQRVPLVLYHFEDMPYQDIAAQLGISLAKVKTDMQRGRLALARKLARAGVVNARLDS